jgi:diguanylate cyclase (GGDEF)-like protein
MEYPMSRPLSPAQTDAFSAVAAPDPDQAALAALHDPSTGFVRPALLQDRAQFALAAARRHRRRSALLRIELHAYGRLLAGLDAEAAAAIEGALAETLRNCVRESDSLGRFGLAGFAVLLAEIAEPDDAGVLAARIIAAIERVFADQPAARRPCASIGVAVYPSDGMRVERLLAAAEGALDSARELAGGGFALADATRAELSALRPISFPRDSAGALVPLDAEYRRLAEIVNALVHDLHEGQDAPSLARRILQLIGVLQEHVQLEAEQGDTGPLDGGLDRRTRDLRFLDELQCLLLHVNAQSVGVAIRHLVDWLTPRLQGAAQRA